MLFSFLVLTCVLFIHGYAFFSLISFFFFFVLFSHNYAFNYVSSCLIEKDQAMALTSSACHAMLLRIIKPKRLTFALTAPSTVNSSRTICPNNPRLCQHGDDWLSNQPISACQTDYNTKLYDQKKEGCSKDLLGSPAVNCNLKKMSRHLKQLVIDAPCVFSRFFSARPAPLAGYYNYCTASSPSSPNGRLRSDNSLTNKYLFHQNHEHNVLYRHQSQRKFSSFSPAKLILELSPTSLQPYLRLIRFDKPIGEYIHLLYISYYYATGIVLW